MKKILISDPVDIKCRDILVQNGFSVDYKVGLSPGELNSVISEYNALIVRSETKVNASLISLMNSMEIIGRAGAGIDNIDLEAATHKGILVMNTPGGNTISAAEHTLGLMLAICRNIPQAYLSLRDKKWERKKFTGTELSGKTLFVIGFGKIGKEVALRSLSFGMKVLTYDPVINPTSLRFPENIEFVSLTDGLERADIITVHVPLNENTKNLISESSLKFCKRGVRIINCARGGIVNEEDTLRAIESGQVSSAAFDVFEKEPPDFKSSLFNHPNIICTPHLGASTEEAQEKVAVQIAEQITEYFNDNNFTGSVNIPFRKIDERLKRYLDLSESMGYLFAQIIKSSVSEIKVSLSGEFLHFNSSVITSGVLKGFLVNRRTDTVNYINAPVLIKEAGIAVSEVKIPDDESFNNLIEITLKTESGEKSIAGTVFSDREGRVVRIDNYPVEFNPYGNFLIYYNIDKPGVLASVSKILADRGYNISGVSLGRDKEAGKALSILGIDGVVSEEDVKEIIAGTNGILDVYPVRIRGGR